MGFVNKVFTIGKTQGITTIVVRFVVGEQHRVKHGYIITCFMNSVCRCGLRDNRHTYTILIYKSFIFVVGLHSIYSM